MHIEPRLSCLNRWHFDAAAVWAIGSKTTPPLRLGLGFSTVLSELSWPISQYVEAEYATRLADAQYVSELCWRLS